MRAGQMQLDALAITDHDTVAGIDLAKQAVIEQGAKLKIISGVELSTAWHGFEIHILGYNVDESDERFLNRLKQQQQTRQERGMAIVDKLNKAGLAMDYDELAQCAKGVISRGHIAQMLVKKGVCEHPQQAFSRYLGKNKKAYVAPKWIDIKTAVSWIIDAGGQASIAHPFHYDMTTKWLRRLAAEFASYGGHAMEVQHPNLAKPKHDLMVSIANEQSLLASVGSDFHAPGRWTELGKRLTLADNIRPIWHDWQLSNEA